MIYALTISIVVLVLCGVTFYRTRTVKNEADFLVAGRTLRWPVLVFTLLSSWIGAGSLLAGAENAYNNGFVALWQPLGGWVWLYIICRFARITERIPVFIVLHLFLN